MDVGSSPPEHARPLSPRDAIAQRLVQLGVPQVCLSQFQPVLVDFVRENRSFVPEIVSRILPADADAYSERKMLKIGSCGSLSGSRMKESYGESLHWLQWLMFEGEPLAFLKDMAEKSSGLRAVCGAVWGKDDLAYRCITCEHDPTCAICVPCFQNGDHKDHDYSIMYTGGGCCDCGDETAWKREGFCSRHKGSEQIQALPDDIVNSMGPVLDALFTCWKENMISLEYIRRPIEGVRTVLHGNSAADLSLAIVEMLLAFCNCNESLLSFVSRRMFTCSGLLDVLVRAERFLEEKVVKKLHELLLKFLGEPLFKYEFAKVFVGYYPNIVAEVIKEGNDTMLEKYPLAGTFSVQIFTVPTLTPRLVREVNLLGIILGCLWDILSSCVGEDGHIQTSKWNNIYETALRIVGDARFVMSHEDVPKYVALECPDISKTLLKLLSLVQGMDPQKRISGAHAEDENESLHLPFLLGHYLGNVYSLLVGGAFSVAQSKDLEDFWPTYAKSGRFSDKDYSDNSESQNLSVCGMLNCEEKLDNCCDVSIPPSVLWLVYECLKSIEGWLEHDNVQGCDSSLDGASRSCGNIMNARNLSFGTRKGRINYGLAGPFVCGEKGDGGQFPTLSKQHAQEIIGMQSKDACTSKLSEGNLTEIDSLESEAFGLLSSENWLHVLFDVSSQEVCFHIPLHRLLSLLLRKAMVGCYSRRPGREDISAVYSYASQFQFFKEILGGFHPYGFSGYVMEHPLRLRVFCAQVRAGMWRKNGDAGFYISDWYRAVRWFEEGLEADLFLLQCCAALAPPDLFIRRIQERFGLSNYTLTNLSKNTEYEPVLVQEMLTIIIQIVSERRFCGFSLIDNLRRDLIYRLSIGDATHSQLVKSLPRDLSKSKELQSAVDALALYSNPSNMKQGKYSLRKECWKELDLYHPRFNSRELQAAEERYSRYCGISSLNAQLPKWSNIFYPMQTICRIATCKAVLQILQAVLYYDCFQELSAGHQASDSVLIAVLHLLSLALDICEKEVCTTSPNLDLFPVLAYACEDLDSGAFESLSGERQSLLSLLVLLRKNRMKQYTHYVETRQCNISSLAEDLLKKMASLSAECMTMLNQLEPQIVSKLSIQCCNSTGKNLDSSSARKEKIRQRQAEILEKMKAEQSKFIESFKSTTNNGQEALETEQELSPFELEKTLGESVPICSFCRDANFQNPMCYLVFAQKSRLTTFLERPPPSWEDISLLGKETNFRAVNVLNDISAEDSSSPVFAIQNAGQEFHVHAEPEEVDAFFELFRERLPDMRNTDPQIIPRDDFPDTIHSLEMLENDIYYSVRDDVFNAEAPCANSSGGHSTNTSESSKIRNRGTTLLEEYAASLSKEASKHSQSSMYSILRHARVSSDVSFPAVKFNRIGPKDCDGIYFSSCGHAVHQECHERYLFSLKQRPIRRLGFDGGHIADADRGELLCPLCRRFVNSILPIASSAQIKSMGPIKSSGSLQRTMMDSSTSLVLHLPFALTVMQSAGKIVARDRYMQVFSRNMSANILPSLEPAIRRLCEMSYPHSHESLATSGRLSHSLLLWNTLAYSITSIEIAARGHSSGLELRSLYDVINTPNGCVLSSLLVVSHTSRSMNCLEVLLRFRGIQLFVESICSGVSGDINLSSTGKRKGAFSPIREDTDEGETFPDIQFWRQAADPVLSCNPFYSLVLVLYCLPSPFFSSGGSFLALVHVFYVVCVLQAMLTCFSSSDFDILRFGNFPLNDVCKSVLDSELGRKCFRSKYMDSSCRPNDMIRRLTLPFLRRCAILWKLIEYSKLFSSCEDSMEWDCSAFNMMGDYLDNSVGHSAELNGVKELENMFQIPPLESVLKDDIVHTLALKWCRHLCVALQMHKHEFILYSTPAVPFKLMQLPVVYQDLLQRYVKLRCSYCNALPQQPALCLFCGKLCSPSWKPCCRSSRCLDHAIACGAGVGVFLLVRRTTILLQRSTRQALWPSLYLDAFGEEDIDLLRGKPLYLNEERYRSLTYLMASHSLDHNSEVLRYTVMSPFTAD